MTDDRGFWDSAWGVAKGAKQGVVEGGTATVEGLSDLVKGGYKIATDPAAREEAWQTTKQLGGAVRDYSGEAIQDPKKVLRDARDGVNALRTHYEEARAQAEREGRLPEFYGNMAGRGLFEVGTAVVPVGAATKLGHVGKGVGAVGKVAKAADKLGDAGKGAKAATAAKAVQKTNSAPKLPVSCKGCQQAPAKRAAPKKPPASKTAKGAKKQASPYDRPSKFRKGVRDKVWEDAKGTDGLVRDPVSGKVMDPSEPWDMGHRPGYEYRKHRKSAQDRGISRKEFLNEHNNPAKYRPELPKSNRSHKGEDMTDDYFGD